MALQLMYVYNLPKEDYGGFNYPSNYDFSALYNTTDVE